MMINFDNNICHLTYSHTEYKDIWPAYFGETRKFLKSNMMHYLCVNEVFNEIPDGIVPLVYDQSMSYPMRLFYCLQQLDQYEFVFFDHEDMFLYDFPDGEVMQKYYGLMVAKELDHIRLIKGGMHWSKQHPDIPSLQLLSLYSKWIFSIQPSFWNRQKLMDILYANMNCNIWDLERRSQKVVKEMKLHAAYSHTKGAPRRGIFHFDNPVYPYVATAISKGKWNLSEYKEELSKVFVEYKIDPSIRGVH